MSDSSGVIPKDIHIDIQLAKVLISRDFPGIKIEAIRIIGEGWDNLVFLVNEQLVFRFPRRSVAISLLEVEIEVLRIVKGKLNLEVPDPTFIGTRSPEFPALFYGHPNISGRTGCQVSLTLPEFKEAAFKLAHALKTLHAIDVNKLATAISPPQFDRLNLNRLRDTFDSRSAKIRQHFDETKFDILVEKITNRARKYEPRNSSLVHGDLYHRHLIFNASNELTGLIDWGDSGLSDPVVDVAILYQFFPPQVHEVFFQVYGEIEPNAKFFAQFLALYYAITLFWFGSDRKDASLTSSSIKTIDTLFQDLTLGVLN